MTTTITTHDHVDDVACPDCGGAIDIQCDVMTEDVYVTPFVVANDDGTFPFTTRPRQTFAVAFCSACEWAHEIRR
jgi:hypothetical protein